MKQSIKVPSVGESITEATVGEWQKKNNDYVQQNEVLVIMETDKASMDLVAEYSGQLNILKQEGSDVKIGEIIAELDTSVSAPATKTVATSSSAATHIKSEPAATHITSSPAATGATIPNTVTSHKTLFPSVKKLLTENNLKADNILSTGPKGHITKGDVLQFIKQNSQKQTPQKQTPDLTFAKDKVNNQVRKRMTTIRKRIAERLVFSQQNTATLTTFNEIDMSKVMSLRAQYKESFQKKHDVKLGFMGFFIKATIYALQTFPRVNAFIEGNEEVYNNSYHIGVAVSTKKGLVVPVIANAEQLTMPELEKSVLWYATKARDGKLIPNDLTGGTFTISNGGVFGSLMSTPILNPPQSGILGLHNIIQKPVVIDGKITIRPMMFVALSYDHRMIDGKESVSFLLKIKECIEDPLRLLMNM